MFGAGLATIIGPTLALIILSFHFFLKKNQVRFTKKFLSFPYLLRTIRNGVGSGLMELSAGVVILAFNIMLMKISGETAVAVFSILSNIGYVSKGIFNGIAQAAQPIISENYGAKRYKPMMYVNRIALVTAGIFSAATLALILIFPEQIILFFVKRTDEIIAMGIPALILYFISLPFTGINIVLMYYFQSIERIKYTSVQSVLRGIVLVILALCLFAYLWGLTGVWLALLAAEAITLLIFYPVKIKLDRGYKQKELSDELH